MRPATTVLYRMVMMFSSKIRAEEGKAKEPHQQASLPMPGKGCFFFFFFFWRLKGARLGRARG